MYKALACLAMVVVGSTGLLATKMADTPGLQRAAAQKFYAENNYADALALYRELAVNPENRHMELPDDLGRAIECLTNLNLLHEADALLETAIESHKSDFRLLARAAQVFASEMDSSGFVIGGQFERGDHRGGVEWASVADRDRVRSLQLLRDAIALAMKDDTSTAAELADLWQRMADQISTARHGEAWKLQDLTDLEKLPDIDVDSGETRYGMGPGMGMGMWFGMGYGRDFGSPAKGAPVDASGNPVFHHKPDSWSAAESDGERWRWAMAQVVQHVAERRSEMDFEWAGFLQSQFGVGASAVGEPPVIREASDGDAVSSENLRTSGQWAAHELADTETIAKL
ncbi:MAG: hypothetical protein O2856_06225, partial [Planctomycetota bacterium]|nr:hypothetical protein [Planctomycetota bacterium]